MKNKYIVYFICIVFLFLSFTSCNADTLLHMDRYNGYSGDSCTAHNCHHPSEQISVSQIKPIYCNDYSETKHERRREDTATCSCGCKVYRAIYCVGYSTLTYYREYSDVTSISASTHTITTVTEKDCSMCAVTSQFYSHVVKPHYASSWTDMGHSGTKHYYRHYCEDCGYMFQEAAFDCPGGGNHYTPYKLPINVVTE